MIFMLSWINILLLKGWKNQVGPTCKGKMPFIPQIMFCNISSEKSRQFWLGNNVNVIGQTACRDHVRECHDRHSRLMLQIMDPILRKIDTVYIYSIYNIFFRKYTL